MPESTEWYVHLKLNTVNAKYDKKHKGKRKRPFQTSWPIGFLDCKLKPVFLDTGILCPSVSKKYIVLSVLLQITPQGD